MNEKKVFKKYLARYLLVMLVVVFCCIPFGAVTYRYIRDYTISSNLNQLEENVKEIDSQVGKMHMVVTMMGEDSNLLDLKRVHGTLPGKRFLYMKYMRDRLFEIHTIYDFSSMSFLLFTNNPVFVSASQVDDDFYDYYGKFLTCGDMDAAAFRNMIVRAVDSSPYLGVSDLTYYGSQRKIHLDQALFYIESVESRTGVGEKNAFMTFIIDGQKIINTLLPEDCRATALLQIQDRTGTVVFSGGENADLLLQNESSRNGTLNKGQYQVLTYKGKESGLTFTVGYPMAGVHKQLEYMVGLILLYLIVGCLAAFLFTIGWTWHWFKPFRRVLTEVAQYQPVPEEIVNEYDYIRDSILKLVSDKDEMEMKMLLADTQKQAILLESIFMKGFYGEEAKQEFCSKYSLNPSDSYYMVEFRAEGGDASGRQRRVFEMVEALQKGYQGKVLAVYPGPDKSYAMLTVKADMDDETLKRNLTYMAEDTDNDQVTVIVGISKRQTDLENIHTACTQARHTVRAYHRRQTNCVEFYKESYEVKKSSFHSDTMRKLYDMLLSANESSIQELFADIQKESHIQPELYEFRKTEIYYGFLFTIHSACQQLELPIKDHETEQDLNDLSLEQCLNRLLQICMEICKKADSKKDQKKEDQKQQLVDYLEQNFSRPELNAIMASEELGISEKYLYALLKEQTGRTFASYLEDLRIQFARQCLEETDWSNEKIAQESGFGSTNSFYRVFKKQTGVSPSVYRKNRKE